MIRLEGGDRFCRHCAVGVAGTADSHLADSLAEHPAPDVGKQAAVAIDPVDTFAPSPRMDWGPDRGSFGSRVESLRRAHVQPGRPLSRGSERPAAIRPSRAPEVIGSGRRSGRLLARVALLVVAAAVGVPSVAFAWGSDLPSEPDRGTAPPPRPAAACGQTPPAPAAPRSYARAPKMALDPDVDYSAVIYTSCGDIRLDLLESRAPRAVNNFVFLAREGFYNGLTWHHVVRDFIIQAGDPNGRNGVAPDNAGYTIADDPARAAGPYTYGAVAMATGEADDSGGSQFFVVVHDVEGALKGRPRPLDLEPGYAVFGRVQMRFFGSVENIARQKTIDRGDPWQAGVPAAPVYIEAVHILEDR